MRAGVIYSPRRPFEYEVPLSTGFQVVVMGDVRKGAALLQAQLVTRATRAIEKVAFPGCRLGGNVPEKTAKGWCLIAASLLPFSPQANPNPCPHGSAEGAVVRRWGDSEEGGCRWEPRIRRLGHQVSFQSFSSRKVRRPLGALGLVELQHGPPGSVGRGPIRREAGSAGARGAPLLAHPPQVPQLLHSPDLGHKAVRVPGM